MLHFREHGGQTCEKRGDGALGFRGVDKQAFAEWQKRVLEVRHDQHLSALQVGVEVVKVHLLVIRHNTDLGSLWQPACGFSLFSLAS